MLRNTSSGTIVWDCAVCGSTEPGVAEDARISGKVHGAGDTNETYRQVIRNSALDPSNQCVKRLCPGAKCGRDYMTQIRVGDNESIVYTCKCGVVQAGATDSGSAAAAGSGGSGSAAAAAAGSAKSK